MNGELLYGRVTERCALTVDCSPSPVWAAGKKIVNMEQLRYIVGVKTTGAEVGVCNNRSGETMAEKVRRIAKVVHKVGLYDQPTDFAYWQSQPVTARLAALEEIRREYHGWSDDARPRLQRVYTIVKRQ